MIRPVACLAALVCVAGVARAEMTTSPRPQPRPAAIAEVTPPATAAVVRPMPRPEGLVPAALPPVAVSAVVRPKPRPATVAPVPALSAVQASADTPRPMKRPSTLPSLPPAKPERQRGGLASLLGGGTQKPASGGFVCEDPDIKGERLAPISSRVNGCGIDAPVRITSIDGIRLRGEATVDCTTAKAMKRWINSAMRPAFARDVVELQIAGTYVCRPRNNVRGNKISEHGRGKAVDISAFVFGDGSSWTVKDDYNRQIRKAHKAACGIFGTTLGPGSDGYHEDHLHFDTAGYRSGPYCR